MKMGNLEKVFVNSAGHSKRVSDRAERLLVHTGLAPNKRYLDIGTGNGAAAIHIARKYRLDVTGIDVDPEQIQLAVGSSQDVENVTFLTLDGAELPFEDGTFDIVSTFKVMHHIPNWKDTLAEMVRVLKPGGHLVYSDLVYPAWLSEIGERIAKELGGYPTRAGLSSFFENSGLSAIRLSNSLGLYEGVFQKNGS